MKLCFRNNGFILALKFLINSSYILPKLRLFSVLPNFIVFWFQIIVMDFTSLSHQIILIYLCEIANDIFFFIKDQSETSFLLLQDYCIHPTLQTLPRWNHRSRLMKLGLRNVVDLTRTLPL